MSHNRDAAGPLAMRADGLAPLHIAGGSSCAPADSADALRDRGVAVPDGARTAHTRFAAASSPPNEVSAHGEVMTDRAGPAGGPALIAVAHGSRDPRSAATIAAVVADVAQRNPGLDVRLAFLDLNTPSVEQVTDAVAAQGHREAVVTPLLLGSAFHARVDLPGMLAAARVRHPRLRLVQADVLGPDPLLLEALRARVLATGADPRDETLGVAVAAVGSSSAEANRRTRRLGRLLTADGTAWHTEVCFATTEPSLPQAISTLKDRGCGRVVLAPWFLAPGLLTDRLGTAAPHIGHAEPLGSHELVAEVVSRRYESAVRRMRARPGADIAVA